jgi:hypothetical protein
MNTQISGYSDRPEKRYSGVYQQQGRMLRDTDANELLEILKRQLSDVVADAALVGAPRRNGVVKIEGQNATVRYGHVYADGLRAELTGPANGDPYDDQHDFPEPPARPSGDHVLYVDVWERTVLPLEDPSLLDPALHGADTCTRTQTMAQLKWCRVLSGGAFESERLELNPQHGTATLAVRVRETAAGPGGDPCDPCAEEIDAEARLGNYLFRLEVHEVEGDANAPRRVVLKWSSENASEAYPRGAVPPDYAATDRVYEHYSADTDRLLGVHFAPDRPQRGALKVDLSDAGRPWVRRWDGACVLVRTTAGQWSLSEEPATGQLTHLGRDRGVRLTPQATELGGSHGAALVAGSKLQLNLQALKLDLDLGGRRFVAGDHWLAVVRDRAQGDARAEVVSDEPVGIVHHYTTLGRVRGGKLELGAADRRRFAFPPLTDIMARDVGVAATGQCALTAGTTTVQEALDRLCTLNAGHVRYSNPTCDSGLLSDAESVKEALDALCDLDAKHVGFSGDIEAADDVHEALLAVWDLAKSGGDVCASLLALFGRGVLCGLIPHVAATVVEGRAGRRIMLTATTSQGRFVNGRGCMTEVEEQLTAGFAVAVARREIMRFDDAALEKLTEALVALRAGAQPLTAIDMSPPRRKWLSDDNLAALTERLKEAGETTEEEVRRLLVSELGLGDRALLGEIVAQAADATDAGPGTIDTDDLWLYVIDLGGDEYPSLELRAAPPKRVVEPPAVVFEAMLEPESGPTVSGDATCLSAHDQAWSMYRDVPCAKLVADGAVCLGRVGVAGDRAWVSPDDREQVFPTPAIAGAHWAGLRRAVHQDLKDACTAGDPTPQALTASDGTLLDGSGYLADGRAHSGVVRLAGPARGGPVSVVVRGSGGIHVANEAVTILPGESSGTFEFAIPVGTTGAVTLDAEVAGDDTAALQATLSAVGLAAPTIDGKALSTVPVLAGEWTGVTIALEAPVAHSVTIQVEASDDVEVKTPSPSVGQVTLAPGQVGADLTLRVAAGKAGSRQLELTVNELTTSTAFTAVALSGLTRADGSGLGGATVEAGASIGARATLSGNAPRDLTVALTGQTGLGLPASVLVKAGEAASDEFAVDADASAEGARTVTATLSGHSVSATVTVGKPKDARDEKEARDDKEARDETPDKETSEQKEIRDERAKEFKDSGQQLPDPFVNPRIDLEIDPRIEELRPFIDVERRPDLG